MSELSSENIVKIIELLESKYGRTRLIARFDAIDELVCCILSQNTTDASSFPTFTRLKVTYPDWQQVIDAGPEVIAEVIRKAGLPNQKSKSICGSLAEIKHRNGAFTLENLRNMNLREARSWLTSLPGVGPKTASIVLCFNFGKGAIPVDTHVFRVSGRIGILPQKISVEKAHDYLLDVVPEQYAYRYHQSIIQHGRITCKAQKPLCSQCVIQEYCEYYKNNFLLTK